MLSEAHAPRSDLPLREIIARMRHDGCGGRAGKVELLTGVAPFCEPSPDASAAACRARCCRAS